MENSVDSTEPGPTGQNLRSIFKRRSFADGFDISADNSATVGIGESILDVSTSKSRGNIPFKRKGKLMQDLNVTAQESVVNSDTEESRVLPPPRNIFNRKQTADSFNVTYCESHSGTNIVESFVAEKPNLFKKNRQDLSQVSAILAPSFEESQTEKLRLTDKQTSNLSINVSKPQSETQILNESSINDDNLGHWMSEEEEESENEVAPPEIYTMTKNTSVLQENLNDSLQRPNWEERVKDMMLQKPEKPNSQMQTPEKPKRKKPIPTENQETKYRPKLIRPAPFVTNRLYDFILKKFKPKYGIDAVIETEDMISCICDTVKKVLRRKGYQKELIQSLKKKMAKAELVETTMDFYQFVIGYLPYDFRVKVVPCLQPITNTVYPPKDGNPFDKIL